MYLRKNRDAGDVLIPNSENFTIIFEAACVIHRAGRRETKKIAHQWWKRNEQQTTKRGKNDQNGLRKQQKLRIYLLHLFNVNK